MPTPRPDAQVRAFVVRNVEFRTPVDVIRGDGVLLIDETPDAPRGCPEVPAMRRNSDPAGRRSGGNERRESALVASLLVARPPAARPFGGWPELAYPASPQYMPQSPTPPAPPPSSQTLTDSEEEARRRKLTSDVEMKDGEREETLPELVEEEVAGWRVLTERLRPRKPKGPPRGYSSSETAVENPLELNEPEQQQTGIEPVEEMDRDGSADDGSAGALADEEGRGRTRTRGTRRVAQRDSPTRSRQPRDFVSRAGSPSAVGKTFASIVREMTTIGRSFGANS
ncbi:hypothetical protein A0H81_12512 [Grifola frondosa]|uniref:Uncharacterized protein n=1 Tax=Grifola frondosa TaxID=5627 RepID=A0A1C7LSU8_GRIFR|nr:hypothetical protein A0H81_12512 [Grifola frondosa]